MVNPSGYVLAFDVGTTSVKCAVVDLENFESVSSASTKAVLVHPKKDWAENEPETLWNSIVELAKSTSEECGGSIVGIVFGAHMAGVVPVDREGEPLRNIITWLDERAAGLPENLWKGLLKIQGYNLFKVLKFLRITGGAPSKTGKDVISKIIWIMENEPDVFTKTFKLLDVKGFLINRCTGEYVTSPDEANLTWLADTREAKASWSESLLKDYNLSPELFPEIKPSTEIAGRLRGEVAREMGVSKDIPVVVGSGDIPSAAIGSGAVGEAELHVYIGTSNWVAGHISKRKTDISHYIGSLLSAIPEKYLLIAEQEVAAGSLEWFLRLMGMEGEYEKVSKLVEKGKSNLIFLPWLYGERAPIDDPYVRGGLLNFSLEDDKEDILRAVMEGVAMNIKWAYSYTEKLAAKVQQAVNMVGGGALFDVWCQIVADSIDRPIKRIKNPQETGIRGAAVIAAVSLGAVESFEEAVSKFEVDRIFKPDKENVVFYNRKFEEFTEIYKKLKKIYRRLNE